MNKLLIKGGKPLSGRIKIAGSKNAALPILAACLLTTEQVVLSNVPHLRDIFSMLEILSDIGMTFSINHAKDLKLKLQLPTQVYVHAKLAKSLRASILLLGPLLTRFKKAIISLPGGCAIGARPIDLHLKGLRAMGAEINIYHNYIYATCTQKLKGANIQLDVASVTATENLIMAATLAEGKTVIHNAAREPEVVDLITFLNKLGAKIQGAGEKTVVIEGVTGLLGGQHFILGDRIEAATFLIAAACTRGKVTVESISPTLMTSVLHKLEQAGTKIKTQKQQITLDASNVNVKAIDIETDFYPGFPTDIQSQMMVFNTTAQGVSKLTENIFENRFLYVPELCRMGADIIIKGRSAICKSVSRLVGTRVTASDLRAAASLVLAGLMTESETVVDCIDYLERGYEFFEEKLLALGANITCLE